MDSLDKTCLNEALSGGSDKPRPTERQALAQIRQAPGLNSLTPSACSLYQLTQNVHCLRSNLLRPFQTLSRLQIRGPFDTANIRFQADVH